MLGLSSANGGKWRLDCEDCRHLTVVGLHDTGAREGERREWVGDGGTAHLLTQLNRLVQQWKYKQSTDLFFSCVGVEDDDDYDEDDDDDDRANKRNDGNNYDDDYHDSDDDDDDDTSKRRKKNNDDDNDDDDDDG